MNNNELILGLIDRLNSSSRISSLSPWIEDLIIQAGNTVFNNSRQLAMPTNDRLMSYVKARMPYDKFDKSKAKYFCFIPIQDSEWNVFVLDHDKKILAQTENFSGIIKEQGNANVEEPFLLEL